VFQYKGRAHDIRELDNRVNVGSVVEGSIRRVGDRIRVTAQLINVADGFHLWSGTLDRQVRDIFAIQEEIAQAIVATLRFRLTGANPRKLVRAQTQDPEAYELCLKGRYHWNKQGMADVNKGIKLFEQAIELDSEFARAWSGLGHCYSALAILGLMPSATACS
jgi:hypothetical protein